MKNRSFSYLSMALYCAMSLFACTLVQANNLPPVAVIDLTPNKAVYYHGETIALYGGNSYVQSSGNINYYQWYINGELKLQGSGATSYNHTVVMESGLAQQSLTIRLRVRHSNGLWGEQTITRTEKQKPGQHYYLTDHLGSVRVTVNAAGTMIGWDDFYPFGMVMPERSSNSANPNDLYKFTGHERDREVGLEVDFMNARTYDSEIGRFLQMDPMYQLYPVISPFTYVMNNPINATDPDGRTVYYVNGILVYDDGEDNALVVHTTQDIIDGFTNDGETNWDGVRNADGSTTVIINQDTYWNWVTGIHADIVSAFGDVSMSVDTKGNITYQTTSQAMFGMVGEAALSMVGGYVLGKGLTFLVKSGSGGFKLYFGRNRNQVEHAFRHLHDVGADGFKVTEAISKEVARNYESLPLGHAVRLTVKVDGKVYKFNVRRFANGDVNVGRIHD